MKKLALVSLALVLLNCSGQKNRIETTIYDYKLTCPCPAEGTCTIEVLKNESLIIKTDDIGKLYYETEGKAGKQVIKYNYTKTTDPALQDAGYSEEIVLETDADFTFSDKSKILFGVYCYCKGKAGYYKADNAIVSTSQKLLTVTIPEIIDGQKIKSFSIALK